MKVNDTISPEELNRLTQSCEAVLLTNLVRPDPRDYYAHVPLAVVDAVFSINARYASVSNVIGRLTARYGVQPMRVTMDALPPRSQQLSVKTFIRDIKRVGVERFTEEVFQNRQRTSTTSGILKGEAVLRFCEALSRHGINHLQDLPGQKRGPGTSLLTPSLEEAIASIPGHSSGVALRYFLMLCGSTDLIKPDRMVIRFLSDQLGRPVSVDESGVLLGQVTARLSRQYPRLCATLLDKAIWSQQRVR